MSNQILPTPLPEASATPAREIPPVSAALQQTEPAPIPENWRPLFTELTGYYRNLPKLLSDGEAGRFVVIHRDELCKTWDTSRDALQYGHERFGDQLFMVHRVDPRDLDRLARFFSPKEAACPG
jgi:hypothetical protein